MTSSSAEEDIPFYLMPVAAVLGLYAAGGLGRIFYVFFNKDHGSQQSKKPSRTTHKDNSAGVSIQLIVSVVLAAISYSFVVAKIERAFQAVEYALFDPYEILQIQASTKNVTVIKQAYRQLAKVHHPDKEGGNSKVFQQLSKAYDALTDERSMRNFQQFGHPDGPLSSPTFQMALPKWLLFPEGNVAAAMLLVYLGMLGILIYFVVKRLAKKTETPDNTSKSLLDTTNSVSVEDLSWLANHLKPDSTHFDVLMTMITCPENIQWSLQDLERVEKARDARLKQKSGADDGDKKDDAFDKLFDEGGWDDDDADDDAAAAARKAEEQRSKDLERLKEATGQAVVLVEGVDKGVLGQNWVIGALKNEGAWPPENLGCMEGQTFEYLGKQVTMLQHPGLTRMLCMTQGRLHSMMLNGHKDLVNAGINKLVDQTYFKASMEFRQRAGMYLEAALRVAMTMHSYRLVGTIVETVSAFKLGIKTHKAVQWFESAMRQQYGVIPRLNIISRNISVPGYTDGVAAGETAEFVVETDRVHAEAFLKQKIEMFKRQGIPPEVGLQTYREGWWIMLRVKRVDGPTIDKPLSADDMPILTTMKVEPSQMALFEAEKAENRLLLATPVIFQKVAQKQGKIKIQFTTPEVPGVYRFFLAIKSQDFLGADQDLIIDVNVLDPSNVKRSKPSEAAEETPLELKKDK